MRGWGCLLAALALAGCDFPEVPRGASAGLETGGSFEPVPTPETPPLYPHEEPGTGLPLERRATRDVEGRLVSNAVSSLVIEEAGGEHVTLQVAPQTELRIGAVRAGLRELQPGSEVRARFVPLGEGRVDVALEVEAEPLSVGWRRQQGAPAERGEGAPADAGE